MDLDGMKESNTSGKFAKKIGRKNIEKLENLEKSQDANS